MLQAVAFGTAVVALNSMRWSVFDCHTCSTVNTTVSGKLGLYHYSLEKNEDNTTTTVEGRINNDANTALCNVLT